MTYEKDIPDYALQPAKAPKIIPAEAIYNKEKITYPAEEQRMVYQFEEDILVPDIKADMREILLMDGSADLAVMQKKLTPKIDDLVNMTGTLNIQTIYNAENGDVQPVAITSRIPYKYQWALNPQDPAEALFSCRIKRLDAMIINERKFRVKVSLEFSAQMFADREFQFFSGLRDETLQMKKSETALTCLGLIKSDEVSVDETFRAKDAGVRPESILKQDFAITENYRQVTGEKIVINGFIFASLLYSGSQPDGEIRRSGIFQHNQRVEFTQFIPIEKEKRRKNWSAVRTEFTGKNLTASIGFDEEKPEDAYFRLSGEVKTRVELYESRRREIVTDAYHREKNFACSLTTTTVSNLSDGAVSETAVREVVSLPEGMKAAEAVYCNARVLECQCSSEKGRVVVSGEALIQALWKDQESVFHGTRMTADFRGSVEMDGAFAGQKATARPQVKSAWVELISDRQLEVNASVVLGVETFDDGEVILVENPHFGETSAARDYPMVIAAMKETESLWDVAKRYRTTEENIRLANHLEGEPAAGQRLLIVK